MDTNSIFKQKLLAHKNGEFKINQTINIQIKKMKGAEPDPVTRNLTFMNSN